MNVKQIRKSVSYFIGWAALSACSLTVKILPGGWLYRFATMLANAGYRFASKQRKIALDSLSIAFGATKTQAELKGIAKDCFVYMAKSSIELLFLMDKPELLKSRVTIQGKEHLDEAMRQGKGAILVSAHFGNFPLLLARLSQEGYATCGIMRQMKDERVEKFFLAKRQKLNIKTIYSQPRNVCVENTIRALRGNELVFIPIDQNFGTGGVFVEFFGRKAATATGPVVLAQRTGARILPCFIVRQKDDTQRIIFEPALTLAQGASPEETISANIQKLTGIIERYIRRYPAEWGWIHRRWKSAQK